MGLAFPLLTHAFNATTGDRLEYDPVLTTMIKQGVMEPMFSLAFERNGDGGVLALGGVPPVILDSPFASTPILIVSSSNYDGRDTGLLKLLLAPTSEKS